MSTSLRSPTALVVALTALLWATPCAVWQGGLDLSVPEVAAAGGHAGHGMDVPPAAAGGHDAHAHHGHAPAPPEPPAAEWKAACPCGCDEVPQPGSPLGGIGYALLPLLSLPHGAPGWDDSFPATPVAPPAAYFPVDHVPIPS